MSPTESPMGGRTLSWSYVRVLLTFLDFIALILALQVAYITRYTLGWSIIPTDSSGLDPLVPTLCLVIALMSYRVFDLYSMQLVGSGLNEYRAVAMDTTLAFAAIVIISYIDGGLRISRAFLLLFWLAAIVLVGTGRFIARRVVRRWSALRGGLRRVIVVGANEQGIQIAEELSKNPAACSVVLGFLSEYRPIGQAIGPLKVLGEPMELYEIAKRERATHAVVVESSLSWESLRFIVRSMHASRAPEVLLAPGLFDVAATPLQSTQLGRAFLLAPRATRIYGFEAFFKRSLDVIVGLSALVITLPIQLVILIFLKLAGVARPVEVIRGSGFGGEVITIWRFAGGPRLRASHLTRLPSLWQVVRGKMSLIGPRPVLLKGTGPYERWSDVLSALKPGFIGPWWLSGQGRPAEIQTEIEADLNYARSYSVWLDLRILAAVAWVLLSGWVRRVPPAPERQRIGEPLNARDDD